MTRHSASRHIAMKDRHRNRFYSGVDTADWGRAEQVSQAKDEERRMNAQIAEDTLHWRLNLRTGDMVLWYPNGIVTLVDRPMPGRWNVSGAQLVGVRSAPEHDLRPVPGFTYQTVKDAPAPVKPLVLGESSLPGAMGGESEVQP